MSATTALDARMSAFAALVGEPSSLNGDTMNDTIDRGTVAPVYRHGTQLGWLLAQASEREMPPPVQVLFSNREWQHTAAICLTFGSLADLTAWAMWADAVVVDLVGTGGVFLGYGFEGAVNEVPVRCNYFTGKRES